MGQHQPPTGNDAEARMMARLAEFERKLAVLEQRTTNIGSFAGLGIQVGKFTLAVGAGGIASAEVTFTTPWANEQLAFVATPHPLASNNQIYVVNCGAYDGTGTASKTKGFVGVHSEVAQNVDIWWMSIGR